MLIDRLNRSAMSAMISVHRNANFHTDHAEAAVRAVLARLEAEGFKPVPVKSTEAMNREGSLVVGFDYPDHVWDVMLAASPKLEEVP